MPKQIIDGGQGAYRGSPVSPAARAGDFIFLSGQIGPIDDNGNELKGIEAQTKQAFEKMKRVLKEADASFSDVVKVTIFLRNADDFEKIGFYMSHKQEVLEELANYNKRKFGKANFCSPPKRRRSKPKHPSEKSDKLPNELRGKHFNSYWEICAALGCYRYKKFMANQSKLGKYTKKKKRA